MMPIVTADCIKEGREMSIQMDVMSDENIRLSEKIEQELRDAETEDALDETTRKLAVVTTIKSVSPIAGADRIVAVTFTCNGWTCVAGKGEFNVGDQCVFFEIDSFLPKEDRYAILEGRCDKTMDGVVGYRLKTIRLRGVISQGLAMPLRAFEDKIDQFDVKGFQDGVDVTALLGVKLYKAPISSGGFGFNIGKPKGSFPHFVKKTDQPRIQSMGARQILDLFGHTFEITEKLDGTSCTMYVQCEQRKMLNIAGDPTGEVESVYTFGVCSRNLELKRPGTETVEYTRWIGEGTEPIKSNEFAVIEDDEQGGERPVRSTCGNFIKVKGTKEVENNSVYWDMAKKYHIEERLTRYCKTSGRQIALQGEIVGIGIQKNPLNLPDVQFFVFDIFDIDMQRYVTADERHKILVELNVPFDDPSMNGYQIDNPSIQHVPLIGYDTITPHFMMIDDAHKATDAHVLEKSKDSEYQGVLGDSTIWLYFLDKIVDNVVQDLLLRAEGKTFTGIKDREGIVFKSVQNSMVSFKVINNVHLLVQSE